MAGKKKSKKTAADPLKKVFEERVAEFTDPRKRQELWRRTRHALGRALDSGATILDATLESFRDNGLSAADGAYRAVQDAQSDYRKLRQALVRQRISADRFHKSWKQIRETYKTRFKSIEQREIRQVATSIEKALGDSVDVIWKLVGEVFSIG